MFETGSNVATMLIEISSCRQGSQPCPLHFLVQPAVLCAVSNNRIGAVDLPSITVSNFHHDAHFHLHLTFTAAPGATAIGCALSAQRAAVTPGDIQGIT
jgi:hypothetical protein